MYVTFLHSNPHGADNQKYITVDVSQVGAVIHGDTLPSETIGHTTILVQGKAYGVDHIYQEVMAMLEMAEAKTWIEADRLRDFGEHPTFLDEVRRMEEQRLKRSGTPNWTKGGQWPQRLTIPGWGGLKGKWSRSS